MVGLEIMHNYRMFCKYQALKIYKAKKLTTKLVKVWVTGGIYKIIINKTFCVVVMKSEGKKLGCAF